MVEAGFDAVLPTGAVSIGPFEVSRRRDGRGDLPMGFQCVADGVLGMTIAGKNGSGGRGLRFHSGLQACCGSLDAGDERRHRTSSALRSCVQMRNDGIGGKGQEEPRAAQELSSSHLRGLVEVVHARK